MPLLTSHPVPGDPYISEVELAGLTPTITVWWKQVHIHAQRGLHPNLCWEIRYFFGASMGLPQPLFLLNREFTFLYKIAHILVWKAYEAKQAANRLEAAQ